MSRPFATTSRRQTRGPVAAVAFVVVVAGVVLATLGATLIGNPFLPLAPVLAVALLMAVTALPLRTSAGFLIVLLIGIDDHQDSSPAQWRTPLAIVGDVMNSRLDSVLGIHGLAVTGMEIALVVLLGVHVYRRMSGSRVDSAGQVPVPSVVRDVMVIYVAAVLLSQVVSTLNGLPAAPWKLRNLLHPIALALLFFGAFRPRDTVFVGRVLALCAVMRAIEVVVVQRIAVAQFGEGLDCAMGHGDSITFAVLMVLLIVAPLESPTPRMALRTALLLPIVALGALQNERRLVWVMVLLTLVLLFVMVPMTGWKLKLTKILFVTFPVLAIYVGVGWNAKDNKLFQPVQTIRSTMDTSVDHSAYWREVEDWNIAMSMRPSPLFGTGLAGKYTNVMPNDDITAEYAEYKEWPHNSVLGLLMLMGLVGFTGIWLLLPVAIFLAARTYRLARNDPEVRLAALGCVATGVACLVQAYGDLGAHFAQYKVFAALAVAFSAKLAVATGAYPVPGAEVA